MNLIIPSQSDLSYRQTLLEDPDTMSYNKGFDMSLEGYDKETGCIEFSESKWANWAANWLNNEPKRFYAYLQDNDELVGEVALRYLSDRNAYMISIIIEGKHRAKGYGQKGLAILLDVAFNKLNADKLIDEFEESRIGSVSLFEKFGFKKDNEGTQIVFSLTREEYLKGSCND